MGTFVRWALKIVLGLLAFLLFETGVAGIPESIASQAAFLSSLGGEWLIRILALLLAFVLALVVIGPYRVQAWVSWAREQRTNQPGAPTAVKPETQETVSTSSEPSRASARRFNDRVRQKFLNLYMDRTEGLQKENEQLSAQKDASEENGNQSNNGNPTSH